MNPQPSLEVILDQLDALLAEAQLEELPAALGALERARGSVLARLMMPLATPEDDELLTMPEVAKRLSINESLAREMGNRGELPTILVGERFVRVRASALSEWVRRREAGGRKEGR